MIDGFIATEDGGAAPGARWDEAMQQSYVEDFTAAEGIVFGRKSYDAYYGHWSRVARGELPASTDAERAWAQRMVAMHKYVLSNTLEDAGGDTTVMGGDVTARVRDGIHLFRDVRDPIPLHPERTVPFASGMALHHYRPT